MSKTPKKSARRPLSRKVLMNLLDDLSERTKRQYYAAAALEALAKPSDGMPVIQHKFLTGLGLALERHREDMDNLLGFVEIIANNRAHS